MTLPRLARTVALAVIIAIGIFNVYQAMIGWTLSDAAAYWQAGLRLREDGDLYPALASVDASDVYRYAPWFAWLAVPWTFLPIQLAGALWSLLLLCASALALRPLVAARAWVLVALFAPILIGISAVGNVHPVLVAALTLGVERRTGPLWIGLAASLKIFPVLFAVVYAGRREWWRFAVALAVPAVLWAPALFYDLGSYATDPGRAALLSGVPVLYGVVAVAGVVATVLVARSRWAWVTAGVAVCLALPRFFVYDLTYLMVGAAPDGARRARAASDVGAPS